MLCNWHLLKSVTVCEHKPLPAAAWLSTEGRSSSKHRGHALCSPLCQDFATKDCYLSTKWEHSYSCCEDNWLAARLWKPSPSDRTVLWEAPHPNPTAQELLRLQQQSSRPPTPITSLHCMITFGGRESVCLLSGYACVRACVCDCPWLVQMFILTLVCVW